MIRKVVDFALNNRILIVAFAVLLFIWGGISFHQLPVEAYPDVANNYVEVITQWPGISAEANGFDVRRDGYPGYRRSRLHMRLSGG